MRRRKGKQRLVAFFLAIMFVMVDLIGIPQIGIKTNIENAYAGLGLKELMAKFPHGKYWNHKTVSGHTCSSSSHTGSCNDVDGWTSTPCYTHDGLPAVGGYDCNFFAGIQCCGFAKKLAYDVYGVENATYTWNKHYDKNNIKPGDIIYYTSKYSSGHYVMVIGVSGSTLSFGECNVHEHESELKTGCSCCNCKISWGRTMNINEFYSCEIWSAPYQLPQSTQKIVGYLDNSAGGTGSVYVYGWTVDTSNLSKSIDVHVYIGGDAIAYANGKAGVERHIITANKYRLDVQEALGYGNYHGYEATISTSLYGSQPIYVYAINPDTGSNTFLDSKTLSITKKEVKISLNKTSETLTSKGTTTQLVATVTDTTNKSVTWKSSNTAVATVNSNGLVTAVGNGTATITATTADGGKTATCKITVSSGGTLGSDGWYYADILPSGVNSTNCEIQYQNKYTTTATSSPGSGWVQGSSAGTTTVADGSVYESSIPLATSSTVKQVGYYYYHFCNASGVGNFAQTGTYTHFDSIKNVNSVYVASSTVDGDDSRYTYYHLKWSNGTNAYCNTASGTCDGTYGSHGNRCFYWYKMYQYQNYKNITKYYYTKTSSWTTSADSTASSVTYRYRFKPTAVTLNKTSTTLTSKGETVTLTSTVTPSNAANKAVTWKSSNTAVATVSSSGVVTAVGNGTATITATTASGGKSASCAVTVSIMPTGVALNKTSATLTSKGATVTLTPTVTPSNAANKSVTWKSSNTAVATVNSNGVVTAVGNGTATITVTTASGGKSASCAVTVSIATTGVTLDKTSATLTSKGQTVTLTPTVSPSNAANKSVTWKSSNTAVATVNSNGVVTAVGNGTATITATTASGGKSASCAVTVSIATTGVTLDKTSTTLTSKGQTVTLTATVSPSNAANKSVTWKSSNTAVATVNSSGVVTAVGNGTATITATTASGGKSASCAVTVSIVPTGVTLDKTSATLISKGQTVTLTATVAPSNAANKAVTWKSSNTAVATVSSSGVVTAVGNGTATITAITASGGKTATCKITVNIPQEVVIVYGDVNDDAEIDIADGVILKKHLAGMAVDINLGACDIDANGTVDVADAVQLMKYLAGYEVTLGK